MSDQPSSFEALFEHSVDGVLLTRPDGTVLRANPAACRALQRSAEEMRRAHRAELVLEDAALQEQLAQRTSSAAAAGELTLRRPDGTTFPAEFTSGLLPSSDGAPLSYVIFRDASERHRAEAALRRSHRALRLLSRCNEAVVRATSESALLGEICTAMVEIGGYRMCWVGLAEHDERRTVRPVAHAGHEDGYLATMDIVWSDAAPGRGPSGTAIRTGQPAIGRDFETDPGLAPWREEARRRGYRSSSALPLVLGSERIGVITMYSTERESFDDEEQQILGQLSHDVAFGIGALRQREAHARAEVALQRSEARLGSITKASPEPIFAKDLAGRWTFMNPATLALIGKPASEVLGKTDRENYSDPAIAEALMEVDQRVMRTGVVETVEETVQSPTGNRTFVSTKAPLRDAEGRIVGLVGTARDITERKVMEEAIRQGAARLRVLAAASQAFAQVAQDYRAVLEQLARQVTESLADSCQVRLLSDDGERLELVALHARDPEVSEAWRELEAEEPVRAQSTAIESSVWRRGTPALFPVFTSAQLRAASPPGRWALYERLAPHSAVVVPLRVRGRRLGVLSMSRHAADPRSFTEQDVALAQELADRAALAVDNARLFERTQHELAERKLAEAERERLAMAIEQAAETVIVTDPRGHIVYVNPAFEQVTGYTKAEALGQHTRILKSGKHDDALYRELWSTISSGRTWHGRLVNKRKDGQLYTEEATISPVRDESGGIVSYVAVKRDVSRDLALEEQLRQSQKMEGIGRLAGGIAHDFNNLLSVILTCAGFALDGAREGDPLRDDLLEIEQAGKRAAALTRQLLAFSRKQVLQPVALDLNRVLADMEKMLRRILGEDIDLVQVLSADLGLVTADPSQIEQVLMNLVVNARDAMPKGGRLTIETANFELDADYVATRPGLASGPYVMIGVTDSGAGIDAPTLARIFEPFFTTKGLGQGSGLGLSTVYGIVKQSGGSISVDSEVGRGTTFKLYLPRSSALAEPVEPVGPVVASAARAETILVVEDDDSVRAVTRRILEGSGYAVMTAAGGEQALVTCQQHPDAIDLVLTDVVMPQMSGRAFVERLTKARPGIKVIYMSGYTDDAIVHHGVLEAGTPFIGKPFTQTELLRKVREVLDR